MWSDVWLPHIVISSPIFTHHSLFTNAIKYIIIIIIIIIIFK